MKKPLIFIFFKKFGREACSRHNKLCQRCTINGPLATCRPPQRFQWPAKAIRKNLNLKMHPNQSKYQC